VQVRLVEDAPDDGVNVLVVDDGPQLSP